MCGCFIVGSEQQRAHLCLILSTNTGTYCLALADMFINQNTDSVT